MDWLLHQLEDFQPISLDEMDSVKLMNRIDTKFMIRISQLPSILSQAIGEYRVLEIQNLRLLPYSSVYFDTPDLKMYTMHQNGKLCRYKVRLRQYEQSGFSFLEIKSKSNKGRTSKKRVEISQSEFQTLTLAQDRSGFVEKITPYHFADLEPRLRNSFSRITMVDQNKTERITLDLNLTFRDIQGNAQSDFSDLIIIEIKQDGGVKSHFTDYLSSFRIKPGSISKYCLGMTKIYPQIKQNAFKKKIRKISKLTNYDYVTD